MMVFLMIAHISFESKWDTSLELLTVLFWEVYSPYSQGI